MFNNKKSILNALEVKQVRTCWMCRQCGACLSLSPFSYYQSANRETSSCSQDDSFRKVVRTWIVQKHPEKISLRISSPRATIYLNLQLKHVKLQSPFQGYLEMCIQKQVKNEPIIFRTVALPCTLASLLNYVIPNSSSNEKLMFRN